MKRELLVKLYEQTVNLALVNKHKINQIHVITLYICIISI